jgi:hypothetical protein
MEEAKILGLDRNIVIGFAVVATVIILGTVAINQFVKKEKSAQ